MKVSKCMQTTRENENRYCIGKILNLRNFRNKLYKKNTADWSKPSKWKLSDSGDEGKFLQRSERADLLADQVVLYDITDYVGDSRTLTLAKIGDYIEFWNSDSIINNAIDPFLRAFGNRAESIQLPENMCIRLYANDADGNDKGAILDVFPFSTYKSDFGLAGFSGVTAIRRIDCPVQPPVITLYAGSNFSCNIPTSQDNIEFVAQL
jgi:hypothetical protein